MADVGFIICAVVLTMLLMAVVPLAMYAITLMYVTKDDNKTSTKGGKHKIKGGDGIEEIAKLQPLPTNR